MRLSEFYSAGVGNLCLGATTKSPTNSVEKYPYAADRVYVYFVSGEGFMEHPNAGSKLLFGPGSVFDVREFQSSDYGVVLPDAQFASWIGFNLKAGGKDYTIEKLSVGQNSHEADANKKTSVVAVSGAASIEGKDILEGKFAYLKRGQVNSITLSEGCLAFILKEV